MWEGVRIILCIYIIFFQQSLLQCRNWISSEGYRELKPVPVLPGAEGGAGSHGEDSPRNKHPTAKSVQGTGCRMGGLVSERE